MTNPPYTRFDNSSVSTDGRLIRPRSASAGSSTTDRRPTIATLTLPPRQRTVPVAVRFRACGSLTLNFA